MRRYFIPFSILFLCSSANAIDSYTELQSGYRDGFYVKTPDDRFGLKFGSRLNFGYTYGIVPGENLSSFDVQHAKFYIGGNAFGKTAQFYVQAAAANNTRTIGLGAIPESIQGFTMEDYYIKLAYGTIDIKLGQYKVPFGRQWMIYSGNLDFVQRSIATQAFLLGRDRGVSLNRFNENYSFTMGIFNGAGTIQAGNPFQFQTGQNQSNDSSQKGLLYVTRLTYSPYGPIGYSEGDVEQTEGHRIEFGGGFAYDENRDYDINVNGTTDDTDVDTISGSGDLTWKSEGLSLQGEFFYRRHQPVLSQNFTTMGYYVQPSYFLVPRKFEIAGRFSWLDPYASQQNNQMLEGAGILNYYISGDHRFKTQVQYSWISQDQPIGRDNQHYIDLSIQLTI